MSATGSIPSTALGYAGEPIPKSIAPADWAAARTALTEALGENTVAPSVPWENLSSATRGTVIPLGETRSGKIGKCREFLMSFVHNTNEDWLQGEACPVSKGAQWKVEQARLLERS